MARNFDVCIGFGMDAPGATLNGTVSMKAHGPVIQPIPISVPTLSENAFQCVNTGWLFEANQDTGGVLAE